MKSVARASIFDFMKDVEGCYGVGYGDEGW